MRKAVFLANLTIITAGAFGMIPNGQGENPGENNRRRTFQQVEPLNEDGRRVRARGNIVRNEREANALPGMLNALYNILNIRNAQRANIRTNFFNMLNERRLNAPTNTSLITAWFNAVVSNNRDEMSRLSREGLDVRTRDRFGNTALHIASRNGNLDLVRWILDYSFNPQGMVQFLSTVKSHSSLRNRDIQVLLRRAFPDRFNIVNAVDCYGRVPLMVAAERGHLPVVQYLIEYGTDINKADAKGATSLMYAAERGHLPVVQYLVEHGADINKTNAEGATSLMYAAERGHLPVVQYLVEHGADINKKNKYKQTPLFPACENGRESVVRYLVEHGVNVNQADIEEDDGGNERGFTAAFVAYLSGHENIARYLIEHGADINYASNYGETLLDFACDDNRENIEFVKYLVEHGIYINSETVHGVTPLYHACVRGYRKTVRYLVENGADINQANNGVETPLSIACLNGYEDIARYLVEHGADVDPEEDEDGGTPLSYARKEGYENIVRYLIEHGATEESDASDDSDWF